MLSLAFFLERGIPCLGGRVVFSGLGFKRLILKRIALDIGSAWIDVLCSDWLRCRLGRWSEGSSARVTPSRCLAVCLPGLSQTPGPLERSKESLLCGGGGVHLQLPDAS